MGCPSAKRGFATEALARDALATIWELGHSKGGGLMPVRVYECKCGKWHLTSRPKRG